MGFATPPPTEAASPASRELTWTKHPFDGLLTAVTIDGDLILGVGGTAEGLAAWTSSDGTTWERSDLPHPGFLAEYLEAFNQAPADETNWLDEGGSSTYPAEVTALLRLDDTMYAFGTFWGANDFVRPVGWRLTDGGSWEFIESASFFFNECCGLLDLAANDQALVATKHNFGDYTSEIWRWTPETSWVETTPGLVPETGSAAAVFRDVMWSQDRLVVVGTRAERDPSTAAFDWPAYAASWTSVDGGSSWAVSEASPNLENAGMVTVADRPGGGYLVAGCTGCRMIDGDPAAWTSDDGLAWSPVEPPGRMVHVVHTNGVLFAVDAGEGGVPSWTSSDGITWDEGEIFEGGLPILTADDERIVLVVRGDGAGDAATVVWVGRFG